MGDCSSNLQCCQHGYGILFHRAAHTSFLWCNRGDKEHKSVHNLALSESGSTNFVGVGLRKDFKEAPQQEIVCFFNKCSPVAALLATKQDIHHNSEKEYVKDGKHKHDVCVGVINNTDGFFSFTVPLAEINRNLQKFVEWIRFVCKILFKLYLYSCSTLQEQHVLLALLSFFQRFNHL